MRSDVSCCRVLAAMCGPSGQVRCLMPGFHHSVAVLPLPFRGFAVPVSRCRCVSFAVYGCNGTEFSYVIFTEQRNFTTAERRNSNGRTATEWWKQDITVLTGDDCYIRVSKRA